jgi:hypothetical protein
MRLAAFGVSTLQTDLRAPVRRAMTISRCVLRHFPTHGLLLYAVHLYHIPYRTCQLRWRWRLSITLAWAFRHMFR